MIALIIIGLGFIWLGYETDWMRVRLLVGAEAIITEQKYARYEVFNNLGIKQRKPSYSNRFIHKGGNVPEGYKWNGEPCYQIILSPGIGKVLCGYAWLDEHCADLVDYEPRVEMNICGIRYDMHIKSIGIIKEVMEANKLSKAEKLLAH